MRDPEQHKHKNTARASRARARHILVPEAGLCRSLRRELREDGADFGAAARRHSKCPSGRRGGDLGAFGRGQMVPEFEAAVFGQALGEVGECVETEFGHHLIVVDERE